MINNIERFPDNPIIRPHMDGRMGDNINGPSLIRVPDWIGDPLGRYYLYFAHHDGRYIRLAVSDRLAGPWKTYEPGALALDESLFAGHIASPDVHVDPHRREIRLYYHGSDTPTGGGGSQMTRVAVSADGLHFTALSETLGEPYFRVFQWDGYYYALAMPGIFYRSREGLGGQRQRVAIGRSIVRESAAFLFDEPLSNLDAALRVEMRFEIAKLHQSLGATMVYVTHDQVEAMTLADTIVVLQAGRIEQIGSPRQLYEQPNNLFVAQFIGSPKMNVVPCSTEGDHFQLSGQGGGFFRHAATGRAPVQLGARPEHITIVAPDAGHCNGEIEVAEYLGADVMLYVNCAGLGVLTVRHVGDTGLRPGEKVGLQFDEARIH